jgi:glyoxylase-like metal-dependent hydrolase (beta-lactamase superfamily II)
MHYTIRPLRNGECVVAGHHAFYQGNPSERYTFTLFVWLIEGGDKPMLVEAGLYDVAEMNRTAAHVMAEPIVQPPEQATLAQLARHGYQPEDIGHVFITHMHFDHVDQLDLYTNAKIVVSARGLAAATAKTRTWVPRKILEGLTNTWKSRVIAVDDAEVLPGIRVLWVGGHTPCSQAICVQTAKGEAIFPGDTVSLLANFERQIPLGVYDNLSECRATLKKLTERDYIILPSHDPGVSDRFPEGVIG